MTIQRKTIEDIIASREKSGGVNGGRKTNLNNYESYDIKDYDKTNVGVNVGVNNMKTMNFSKRQIIIKEIINQNPMITAKQMSEALSVTQRTIERDLSALQKAKVIRHEGSDKSGIWVVLEPYNTDME
ncbi:MAG: HTH domain-containing protein [Parabacteroides sp.]|nr:HTH domain-containing protein [Parabacteroides sp.]